MILVSHPAGGYLSLLPNGDTYEADVHWPFDLEPGSEDWITIRGRFPLQAVQSAIMEYRTTGKVRVHGRDGSYIEIRRQGDTDYITIRGAGGPALSRTLELPLPEGSLEF